MKNKNSFFALATIIASSAFVAPAMADDNITLQSCPAAVQKTVGDHLKDGKVDDIDRVVVEGRTLYKVEIDQKGKQGDDDLNLYIAEDGALLKTREDIQFNQAPVAVQEAVTKLLGQGGKVDDVDREVAKGKVTYLVEIDRAGDDNDLKVVVAEDGSVLSQRADD